ncbi:MAG: CBS domain-containing protein [Vicinamibacteraceae bacterium]|nr:CBS domain-containing protein [Vicinamibacteraceae bacterium]
MATTVRQMLVGKHEVYAVSPRDTVLTALGVMAQQNIGAVLVLDGGDLSGIFSERDYARKVVLQGKASKDTPVAEVMTTRVVSIAPDWTAEQCMALMTDRRIRHLPVLDGDRLVGVISIGDVVRAVVREQEDHIHHLEHYITSGS